jgi:hypothetical protein
VTLEIELHIETLDTERRWNRLQSFDEPGTILGKFLSFRDDETFIWLRERDGHPSAKNAEVRHATVRAMKPAIGSTIRELRDFDRIHESPVLELRQYRLRPHTRNLFATFLRDRTFGEHERLGMAIYGPFDALDDEDVLVWFRGFPSLQERDRRKADFYQSRLWLDELENEAFSMIEDYRNVILITPVH